MYKVLYNSEHSPVGIAKWLNDELALGNKFVACNGDYYIFEAALEAPRQGTQLSAPKISCEQLEEWAQIISENCGSGKSFNLSLYDVIIELRAHVSAWNAAQKTAESRSW